MKLQVLMKPPGHAASSGVATFSGFGPEDLEKLFSIANVRYMGDASFEMGNLWKCLYAVATARDTYKLHTVDIRGTKFFILIPADKLDAYVNKITIRTESNFDRDHHGLLDVISGKNPAEKGWIDIYEKVLFFVDEEMAKKMDEFLQIENE